MNGNVRLWLALLFLGCAATLRAEDNLPPPPVDTDTSPYHLALLAYKGDRYDDALKAINEAEKANPDDLSTKILKARILTEEHDYAAGEALLQKVIASNNGVYDAQIALGDLYLRQHDFPDAVKIYNLCLAQKPNNPDLLLNLIYALVGTGDYVTAGKYFSQLKPFDPDHPSYYFAKAALAQSTGKASEIDEDLETVRTIYGITTANRYFKTYLQVFVVSGQSSAPAAPPSTNALPATPGKNP
ncbi:MAG: tetratricopeptide repeat protein [Methylacidiphilales bacterium]|nr:tetratricopeptide repeat protein [Candidatus Methylacidiphilales bacterium]